MGNVLTQKNKMCLSGIPAMPGYAYKLLDFLATGPVSNQSGVYRIMTGAMGDYISHDTEMLSVDDWCLFRQLHPRYQDRVINPRDPLCYPILDLLEDEGFIKYDKKNHIVKINNIYHYITIGGNHLKLLQNLQNNFKDVGRHSFFHEYLSENKEMLGKIVQKASEKFDEYIKKNTVTEKTVNPSEIEVSTYIRNMLEMPSATIAIDESVKLSTNNEEVLSC